MAGADKEELARLRAEKIIRVQSGQTTAREAAQQLGVSRKTYYKWEKRLLSRMVETLSEREAGRPVKETDPEKEALLKRTQELEKEILVLKQTLLIRDMMAAESEKPKGKAGRRPPQGRLKQQHDEESSRTVGSEKGGASGQGLVEDRDSSAKPDGVLPGDTGPEARKSEKSGSAGDAATVVAEEYGLEKKRVQQDGL